MPQGAVVEAALGAVAKVVSPVLAAAQAAAAKAVFLVAVRAASPVTAAAAFPGAAA